MFSKLSFNVESKWEHWKLSMFSNRSFNVLKCWMLKTIWNVLKCSNFELNAGHARRKLKVFNVLILNFQCSNFDSTLKLRFKNIEISMFSIEFSMLKFWSLHVLSKSVIFLSPGMARFESLSFSKPFRFLFFETPSEKIRPLPKRSCNLFSRFLGVSGRLQRACGAADHYYFY